MCITSVLLQSGTGVSDFLPRRLVERRSHDNFSYMIREHAASPKVPALSKRRQRPLRRLQRAISNVMLCLQRFISRQLRFPWCPKFQIRSAVKAHLRCLLLEHDEARGGYGAQFQRKVRP